MGQVSQRLRGVYDSVKPNTPLPIIVTVQNSVTPSVLNQARQAGAENVQGIPVADAYRARATQRTAEALARLPSTDTVHYNEPASTLEGR